MVKIRRLLDYSPLLSSQMMISSTKLEAWTTRIEPPRLRRHQQRNPEIKIETEIETGKETKAEAEKETETETEVEGGGSSNVRPR